MKKTRNMVTNHGIRRQGSAHLPSSKRLQGTGDARHRPAMCTGVHEQADNTADSLPSDRLRNMVLLVALALPLLPGCTRHEIESRHDVQMAPIEVKPIHITIDLNIKVDRALDDFFDDLDQKATADQQK